MIGDLSKLVAFDINAGLYFKDWSARLLLKKKDIIIRFVDNLRFSSKEIVIDFLQTKLLLTSPFDEALCSPIEKE